MSVWTPDPEPDDNDETPGADGSGSDPLARFDATSEGPSSDLGWLSEVELAESRRRLPILYVEAVPVQVDGSGRVTAVGLLLRATPMGEITRSLVSGRVRYGETVRNALARHLENDLGPMAFPVIPLQPTPFTVAEYFPIPGVTRFHDERQHAVSLAFVVPVSGSCQPRQDALEVTWVSPAEATSSGVCEELEGGRGALVRMALASVGALD